MLKYQVIPVLLLQAAVALNSADPVLSASPLGFMSAPGLHSRTSLFGSAVCPPKASAMLAIQAQRRSTGRIIVLASTEGLGAVESGLDPPTLNSVKNVRDLASVNNSPIKPGRYCLQILLVVRCLLTTCFCQDLPSSMCRNSRRGRNGCDCGELQDANRPAF